MRPARKSSAVPAISVMAITGTTPDLIWRNMSHPPGPRRPFGDVFPDSIAFDTGKTAFPSRQGIYGGRAWVSSQEGVKNLGRSVKKYQDQYADREN
jgi:hypothetical protein